MATKLGITLEEMQQTFRDFVASNPLDDEAWRKDVELGWPYIT